MLSKLTSAMKTVAGKVLDTAPAHTRQYQFLTQATRNNPKFDLEVKELKELVRELKRKHAVDSIVVAHHNGSLLVSSNGANLKEAITGASLLGYIQSEVPKSDAVFIKEKDWYMLYPANRKVYIVRASNNLHAAELSALAEDLEEFLKAR